MVNLLGKAFVKTLKGSKLHTDGNRYSKDFVKVSVTITTKCGNSVCHYSNTQKNLTSLYNQCKLVIDTHFVEGKHNLKITIA